MKTKKELNLYPFYDLCGMEQHLADMAAKGWFIKKTGTLFWEYGKGEPADLQYGVCWSGEADAYEPKEGDLRTFKEQAKASGWKPAAMSERLMVYSADKDNRKKLSVSPFDRILGVQQAAKPNLFLYGTVVFLGILSLFLFSFKMKIMPVTALAGSFTMMVPMVLSLLALYFLSNIITYFVWKNQADILAAGKRYVTKTYPMAKFLSWILVVSLVLLGFGAVTGGASPMLGIFFVCLIVILGLLMILKALRSGAKEKSRALVRIVDVALAVILVVGVTVSVSKINQADVGLNEELPVTVQELGISKETDSIQDYARTRSSGLLRYTEASQVLIQEDGNYEPLLSYELVEGRAVPVDGMVLDHYLSRMASSARKDEAGEVVSVSYKPIDEAPWKARKAWQMTDGTIDFNVYLVLYENKLVELGVPEPLTSEQMQIFGTEIQK